MALFSDSLGLFTSIALGFVPKDPLGSDNGPKQNFQKTWKTCLTSAQYNSWGLAVLTQLAWLVLLALLALLAWSALPDAFRFLNRCLAAFIVRLS